MPRVHLEALGCRLNEAELEQWSNGFREAGFKMVSLAEEADLVVLNTCAVTAEAVRKSRKHIARLHRANPHAQLVVSGCHASLSPQEVEATLGVDLVVANADKDRLVDIAIDRLDLEAMPAMATEPGDAALFALGRQRAFVKVQDGCRYQCSYCIVTTARGEERSRPVAEIVAEINRLHAQDIHEVVITGVQLGGYGRGIGSSLPRLIDAVLADTDIERVRLGSVEPWVLDEDLPERFANPRLMPHLHLPLQSGADSVLRRMARRTRVAGFADQVARLRAEWSGFNVTTDIIVGFPGETDAEWAETLAWVERIGFGHVHIFSYSERDGTKAARLPDKVPGSVKKARSHELHDLAARLKLEAQQCVLGSSARVLWEGRTEATPGGGRRWAGYTPQFHRVSLEMPAGVELENRITEVELVGVDPVAGTLIARP
ncbi:MAG: tRNA (N(6)-L-threonylcarbamoyladenosine(37)-C(2))-methylthiotransferase MtaB [Chromatiales bacterium]|nr:tRNA (N(6)-L-threonylcarbamoyladenosine(37)-C(2))-methylthiotransferase MtaB [Gammaproteobacteria bacterium]MCP5352144.1 tRNA (N(6)-L-threonylcarbamoyladenosine(37)-C(2))-methylthiotransferase MtaB [Chromatiales bacterium]